jgi:sugar (pentulose or hexulose) kinase
MGKKENTENQKTSKTGKKMALLGIGILAILISSITIVVVTINLTQPERSVANFCSVAKEQKSVLITGNEDYGKRLEAYKKLEAVSPDEIRSDITTIRKGYESIVANPSSTITAGLGISGAENRRTDYITKNCSDF